MYKQSLFLWISKTQTKLYAPIWIEYFIYLHTLKVEAYPGQEFALDVSASDEFNFTTVAVVQLIDSGAQVHEAKCYLHNNAKIPFHLI